MNSLYRAATVILAALTFVPGVKGAAGFLPADLRCESLRDPRGIDAACPRFSWVLEPSSRRARGQAQTAYRIMVAGSLRALEAGKGDLWDSGPVGSDQTIQIRYAGSELQSGREYFWRVRAWDEAGKASKWSQPARFSMGLLQPEDWRAKWIGRDEKRTEAKLQGTDWIWFPEGRPESAAPVGTRWFRRVFTLESARPVKAAHWLVTGDNQFTVFVNGTEAGSGGNFKAVTDVNVRDMLRPGKNLLAAQVKNVGNEPNPAGFLGLLRVEFDQGEPVVVTTDDTWRTSAEELPDWQKPGYDDSTWLQARKLGPVGMEPWGEVAAPEDRRLAARWLRKEFPVEREISRATVYMSGLGLSELYLNGKRVGNDVLSPGLTEYNKRVFYVTHEVTGLLRRGPNAIGVVLGNGRFYAPRRQSPTDTRDYGYPKLLLQLRVQFADGTESIVVSDETWKLSTDGPIRANNEYDGEEYDARKEFIGWANAGFDDSAWSGADLVAAPGGVLAAQMTEPIRVTQVLKPVALTQPRPGVSIFDMGQNMVGWCRLSVSGPAGLTVSLRHAETLKPDGTLYLDNIRGAKVTDTYTLKGRGRETYEPRFTYHGFRYVELTGFPGKPDLSAIEGKVVHDDLESAGGFVCSQPLLNRIYTNVLWGVQGNYRSIPTDCPQRDERQGWLGDRSAESKGETYLFNTATLYAKWLQDMADAQRESGSVPDVCPSYWPIYSDNVTWPSSTVIIPGALYRQFGDRQVVETHYESARKWMEYMGGFITNGIISRDSYGDWCVPPEDPKLIHSNDPKRKTDRALLATAYFYWDARLMAEYAGLLRKSEDVERFNRLAESLKAAFNQRFWNEQAGYYDNGSQTSCVLPLAFNLVAERDRARLFQHLVSKIADESQGHVGTGLIGGQWLMQVLTANGRPDLAYQIATRSTYPGWGYMVSKDATTIWELWNGDTADPAMNSGNHVMLVGDLVTWLYEDLGGIRPDASRPAFQRILMNPQPVGDLRFVRASHRSPCGNVESEWTRDAAKFRWRIVLPPNTSAVVGVPCQPGAKVWESGKPAAQAKGIRWLRDEGDRAFFEIGSGQYRFEAPL